ncbi:MAG: TolC family protein [Gemmatimonadota bacterium]
MTRRHAAAILLASLLASRAMAQPAHDESVHDDTLRIRLADMVRIALQRNLDVRQAGVSARASSSAVLAAQSAFDPAIQIGPTYTSNGRVLAGQSSELASRLYTGAVQGALRTGTTYQVGTGFQSALPGEPLAQNTFSASVVQPLLRGFRSRATTAPTRAAEFGVDAARARLAQIQNETVARIEAAYYLLVEQERAQAVEERSLKRAEDLLVANLELRRIGRITEIDLTTARLGVTSRQAALLRLMQARHDAQDALVFAVYGENAPAELLKDDEFLLAVDTAVVIPELPPLGTTVSAALTERPDIAVARSELDQSRVLLDLARDNLRPSVGLAAGFSTLAFTRDAAGFSARDANEARLTDWRAGLLVTYPIGNHAAKAEAERADAIAKGASLALLQAENATRVEVRSAYRGITIGRQRLTRSTEAMRLAREQYEGERERLALGLSDIFRLLQYEEQESQAEFEEARAWFDLVNAVVRYRADTGQSVRAYTNP